jgi:hypothetical protein
MLICGRILALFSLIVLAQACAKHQPTPAPFAQKEYCSFPASRLSGEETLPEARDTLEHLDQKMTSFLAEHKIQEAIWMAEKSTSRQDEATQLKSQLNLLLTTGDFKVVDVSLDGANTRKKLLEFENGIQALFKPNAADESVDFAVSMDHKAEIAAYRFDQLLKLGIVPMTVERTIDGEVGSLQYFIHDVKVGTEHNLVAKGAVKMKVFDFIVGNIDRKLVNFLFWERENQVIAIDHGMAFKQFQCGEASEIRKILELDESLKSDLGQLSDDQVRAELTPYVQRPYLEDILTRIHLLQPAMVSAN